MRRLPVTLAALALALASGGSEVAAQTSFTPSYNAPYRAFDRHEFGGTLSFPSGPADLGLEGQFRFAQGRWDVGVRGGIIDYDGGSDVVLGVEGRLRVLDHTENEFPLDGAFLLGVGTVEFDGWIVPMAGLSLGRRVDLEDFSFIAYGQPTLFVLAGNNDTDVEFGLGLGADFRIGDALDLRTSVGIADVAEGVAFSLVWVR
jgi:hypothetical protein